MTPNPPFPDSFDFGASMLILCYIGVNFLLNKFFQNPADFEKTWHL
jgi:hypothetical protein